MPLRAALLPGPETRETLGSAGLPRGAAAFSPWPGSSDLNYDIKAVTACVSDQLGSDKWGHKPSRRCCYGCREAGQDHEERERRQEHKYDSGM